MITAKKIRQSLVGHEVKNILVSDGGYQLVHTVTYKGWADTVISVDTFTIYREAFLSSHATIQ
jgi:hypothetical protein